MHVVGLTGLYYGSGALFDAVNNGVVTLLHYTRETFMFLTGLVLFYQYYDRDIAPLAFWRRRFPPTVIPYVFWSLLYVVSEDVQFHESFQAIARHAGFDLLLGTASYQLYYMIVTFQFYLIFPLLLWLFRRYPEKQTGFLLLSALWEFLWLAFLGPLSIHPYHTWWPFGAFYQSHFVLTYLFYFVLGAWTALNLGKVMAFLRTHRRPLVLVGVGTALVLEVHYVLALVLYRQPAGAAASVLQPVMILYSAGVVLLSYLLAIALAREGRVRRFTRTVMKKFADASFGIYLSHALFLSLFLNHIDRDAHWPVLVLMVLSWAVTLALSYLLTVVLMRIPWAGMLVGQRAVPARPGRKAGLRTSAAS